jgi:hypothetical protein
MTVETELAPDLLADEVHHHHHHHHGDVDPDTGFLWAWEDDAAWFIHVKNEKVGMSAEENSAEANWFAGIQQLQGGSWKQPWGQPETGE